jgi:hypothetical protein
MVGVPRFSCRRAKQYGTNLATDISYDRGSVAEPPDAEPTVILVGNSNANYLATALAAAGYQAAVVEMRPWWPNSITVNETKLELEAKLASTRNIQAVIFWCLDHAAFYSITDDSILPAVRDTSGAYHIHGSLITAPTEMFSKSVKACSPLFGINTQAKKLVLSPLPRYWHSCCCAETDHVANLDEPEYENALFSGLDTLRCIIKDALFVSNVRDVTVLNTTRLCVTLDGARNTSTDIREALAIMWGDDPVHSSCDCYQALAEHLQSTLKQQQHGSTSTSASLERPL